MGDGNSGVGRGSNASGDTRHHLNRNVSLRQVSGFFPSTAKQEGITPLQAHHGAVLLGHFHEHCIGAGLGHRMMSATLADKTAFAGCRHKIQHFLGHQRVVHQGIALAQQPMRLQREQLGIAGTGSHQINGSGLFSGGHGRETSRSIRA